MTQRRLAFVVGMNLSQLSMFERTGRMPRPRFGPADRVIAIRAALEATGVIFTNGAEPGVKLRKGGE